MRDTFRVTERFLIGWFLPWPNHALKRLRNRQGDCPRHTAADVAASQAIPPRGHRVAAGLRTVNFNDISGLC